MRHATSTLLMLSLFTALAPAARPAEGWYRDLAKAQGAARENGRPLFIVFRCET